MAHDFFRQPPWAGVQSVKLSESPCHRVVGTDGRLTGFAGGLEAKERS
ncbi:MAG: MGMT family protein [Bradyrhizobium sp.]|nr:MGMT family protein [Bradyrhizobium sp.]MDE2243864.1 MGMT family protein [Bradyrhizobium sp.]MDE2473158.1 MGMT family protein [Bradyrhizobium sp.]